MWNIISLTHAISSSPDRTCNYPSHTSSYMTLPTKTQCHTNSTQPGSSILSPLYPRTSHTTFYPLFTFTFNLGLDILGAPTPRIFIYSSRSPWDSLGDIFVLKYSQWRPHQACFFTRWRSSHRPSLHRQSSASSLGRRNNRLSQLRALASAFFVQIRPWAKS